MCGRYVLYDIDPLEKEYEFPIGFEFKPNYNVAPTQTMPVITDDGLKMMRWGLIPRWAKDEKIGYKMINAKSETVFEKPMWRGLITKKRCLVPANGFYEWQKRDDGKQPYFICLKESALMTMAGMWETWVHNGEEINTYTILTTSPNKEVESIHDRMPVIVHEDQRDGWFGADNDDLPSSYFAPYEDGAMKLFEVSKEVNVVKTNNDKLILPINSK